MTQDAVVLRNLEGGYAEVAVTRGTACGGTCGSCEACKYQTEMHIAAKNLVNAVKGQKVTIESQTSLVFRAAFLVYVIPLVFLIAGYAFAASAGATENMSVLAAFAALIVGILVVVLTQRNKKPIQYNIISIERKTEGI